MNNSGWVEVLAENAHVQGQDFCVTKHTAECVILASHSPYSSVIEYVGPEVDWTWL